MYRERLRRTLRSRERAFRRNPLSLLSAAEPVPYASAAASHHSRSPSHHSPSPSSPPLSSSGVGSTDTPEPSADTPDPTQPRFLFGDDDMGGEADTEGSA